MLFKIYILRSLKSLYLAVLTALFFAGRNKIRSWRGGVKPALTIAQVLALAAAAELIR